MTSSKNKLRKFKNNRLVYGFLGVLVLVFAAYFFGMKANIKNETKISSDLIKNQILSVKELTTLKYKYTNVGAFENQTEFYGMKIPLTEKKFIISYDGEVNAGVNLDEIDVKVDEKNERITVKMPKAEILNNFIDEDSLTIFDERESIFNQLKLNDFSDFRKDEMKKTEKELIEKGFLEEADKKTKTAIEEILKINPLIEDYEIKFN